MATLFDFQERVYKLLQSGRSVILQAPTGAGKTRAALFPFLDGWRNEPDAFPRQCIYSVPMRVLANQFEEEYKGTVEKFTGSHGLKPLGNVKVQTGARPDDRRFEGDLIFTTIDQVLSSFLTIPYSLGLASANLNAGAVIGSYLVFDEFHLFPVDADGNGALATTLRMLQMLRGITPFVLMTATFSETMIKRLATLLDAEPLIVTDTWLADIPSQQNKERRLTRVVRTLQAENIWADFQIHQRERAIAICNTVERAQQLGNTLQQLAQDTDVHVEILHSRFFEQHRRTKEATIRHEFGERDDSTMRSWSRAILVATQVVEVGLNISAEVLHTELAPAAALVQRAGRCARFAGERGDVYVYAVPTKDDGSLDYAPYLDEGQSELCSRTWDALEDYNQRSIGFADELALVEQVHRDYDTALLNMLDQRSYSLDQQIADTWRNCDRRNSRELIRFIDNRTILIHPDPSDQTIPDPYACEGISIGRNRLLRWWREAQEAGADLDWMVKYPHSPEKQELGDAEQLRWRRVYDWRTMHYGDDARELIATDLLVVNPALVTYDEQLGFRFIRGDDSFIQPMPDTHMKRRNGDGPFQYRRETYKEHIENLYRVYQQQLGPQIAAVSKRLAMSRGMSTAVLDRAIRLMIATHDLGKLNRDWQDWARRWQYHARSLPGSYAAVQTDDYMYAHTDYDPTDPAQQTLQRKMGRRPNHAVESAVAALNLLLAISRDYPTQSVGDENRNPLYFATVTAIMRHHVATADGSNREQYDADAGNRTDHYAARKAFVDALQSVGLKDNVQLQGQKIGWSDPGGATPARLLAQPEHTEEMLLYLLLVRILRLCDQRALDHTLP